MPRPAPVRVHCRVFRSDRAAVIPRRLAVRSTDCLSSRVAPLGVPGGAESRVAEVGVAIVTSAGRRDVPLAK